MPEKYVRRTDRNTKSCPFNEGVMLIENTKCVEFRHPCTIERCATCGWNPEVAEKRLMKIMGKEIK